MTRSGHSAGRAEAGQPWPLRVFVCGTRAVERMSERDWRVVCATCRNGGSVCHITLGDAQRAAIRDSVRRCRACGAS